MTGQFINQEKLRRVQLAEMEIFKEIKRICEGNRIQYFLSSGTLLGAIRHGGFIPWDDDMDICMPRPDYNKFREIAKTKLSDKFFCVDYRERDTNDLSVGTMLKVASKSAKVKRVRGDGSKQTIDHVWVDIFPLDGLPDEKLSRRVHEIRLKMAKRRLSFSIWKDVGVAKQKTLSRKILAQCITILHLPQLLNLDRKTQRQKLEQILQKYKYRGSKYCINMLGDYELREICPTDMYGRPKDIVFEGILAACPQDPEGILEIIYGEYNQLPPENERVCKHCIDIIEEEND